MEPYSRQNEKRTRKNVGCLRATNHNITQHNTTQHNTTNERTNNSTTQNTKHNNVTTHTHKHTTRPSVSRSVGRCKVGWCTRLRPPARPPAACASAPTAHHLLTAFMDTRVRTVPTNDELATLTHCIGSMHACRGVCACVCVCASRTSPTHPPTHSLTHCQLE